jgi:hypothetical protein
MADLFQQTSKGNYDTWKIHMRAMKEMVHLKGGFLAVNRSLQMKLYRYGPYIKHDILKAVRC